MSPTPPLLKPSIAERIDSILGIDESDTTAVIPRTPAAIVSSGDDEQDLETDFNIARGMLHHNAETMTDLSDAAAYVAKEKQDAKSFESAAMVAKEARATALSFLELHRMKAEMKGGGKKTGGDKITQNNVVFSGTTGDLLKLTRDLNIANGVSEVLNTITVEPERTVLNTPVTEKP